MAEHPGDKGQMTIGSGMSVDKDSPVVETIGVIQELDAAISVVESASSSPIVRDALLPVRRALQQLGEQVSSDRSSLLAPMDVERVEILIRALEGDLQARAKPASIVRPLAAAFAEVAGAQCRRAERRLFTLSEVRHSTELSEGHRATTQQFQYALQYLNRVSDLLALIAESECRATPR
jgi:cob(I)alamin adenosyltransferase